MRLVRSPPSGSFFAASILPLNGWTKRFAAFFPSLGPRRIQTISDEGAFGITWDIKQVFDLGNGLTANYLSLPDLLAAKLAAGRHIDLADADNLKIALARKQKQSNE